jgi:isopenicillin N synthase-like dioxygenase
MTRTPKPFEIPTIDISAYKSNPSSPEALKIVEQVRNACMTVGFFQLVGHGIPRDLQDAVFRGSAAFFALPASEKKKVLRDRAAGAINGGYEVIGTQGLEQGKLPDLNEVLPFYSVVRGK